MDNQTRCYYAVFETGKGWVGVSGSNVGLLKTTLPQNTSEGACLALGKVSSEAEYSEQHFNNIIDKFLAYFAGIEIDFAATLDLSGRTPFEIAVWKATRSIPYGDTRSYAEIARRVGNPAASRAVGGALGRNPLPIIIPCHRVITSNGKLGGFGGGIEMKRLLLDLEAGIPSR